MSGPEDNPADSEQPTKEAWEKAMGTDTINQLTQERDQAIARAELAEAVCRELEYGQENHPDDSKLRDVFREWKRVTPSRYRLEGHNRA